MAVGVTSVRIVAAALFLILSAACDRTAAPDPEEGFVSLFDGETLDGWRVLDPRGDAYYVRDGLLICAEGGGGNLLTERQYSDFVFRFDFRLEAGSNNGVGIRTPPIGRGASRHGMEIQILDDSHPKYAELRPWQYHGSVYGIVPARKGSLRPVGEWNEMEVAAIGRRIRVVVNGETIVDADLNGVTDPEVLHNRPGMFRERGHVGFLGHNDYVEFRNIRIKDLSRPQPSNVAPEGFTALFNGRDLAGWRGLVESPPKRARMGEDELRSRQIEADELMRRNWIVEDGAISYVGDGYDNLCTVEEFGDFELHLDWRIEPGSDSGVYLRGTPQVQIWDGPEEGSGGLWNNRSHPGKPLKVADLPVGEWNRMKIVMTGERVTVLLNEETVVDDVVMENFWEREKPIYERGPIELQAHTDPVSFRNIFARRLD